MNRTSWYPYMAFALTAAALLMVRAGRADAQVIGYSGYSPWNGRVVQGVEGYNPYIGQIGQGGAYLNPYTGAYGRAGVGTALTRALIRAASPATIPFWVGQSSASALITLIPDCTAGGNSPYRAGGNLMNITATTHTTQIAHTSRT